MSAASAAERRGLRAREPGWPLGLLFVGYPLWWLLGITLPMIVLTVVLLIVELVRMPALRLPRFGSVWVIFLAWVVVGVVVVQVNAPLAIAGWNTNRYLTWAVRLFWYVAATTLLLYLGNLTDRVARTRVYRAFGWMFVWIVLGGMLGIWFPNADFPSLAQALLPRSLSANAFVTSLVHPNLAEHMLFAGVTRTSAPFPYANVWGLNFACFLPFFVLGWTGRSAGWKRRVAPVVLAIAVVPVVESLNRGLWGALILAGLVLVGRSLAAGHTKVVLMLASGVVLLVGVIVLSPLHSTLAERFSSPNSNESRATLAGRGFESTLSSPIVGYGTTRDVQGSFSSIAGGATPDCPRCGAPAFGTQGQIYLTTFAQGYVGAALYLGFLALVLLRGLRRPGAEVTMGLCVLAMHGATLSVYSADNLAVVPIFAAAGVLWRAADEAWAGVPLFAALVRHRPAWVLAATACGGAIGMGAYLATPHEVSAGTQVLIGDGTDGPLPTLDTVAQMVSEQSVVAAVAAATHEDESTVSAHVSVTAYANTRVLAVTYAAPDAAEASTGSAAAAQGLLDIWSRLSQEQELADQQGISGQLDAIDSALAVVDTGRRALSGRKWGPVGHSAGRQLQALQQQLVTGWTATDATLRTARTDAVPAGRVVGSPTVLHPPTPWAQPLAEGLALGFLVAPAAGLLAGRRRSTARGGRRELRGELRGEMEASP